MSRQEIKKILDYVKHHNEIANKMTHIGKTELAQYILDLGFNFTLKELETFKKEDILGDDDLKSVAGGTNSSDGAFIHNSDCISFHVNCSTITTECYQKVGGYIGDESICSGVSLAVNEPSTLDKIKDFFQY